MLRSDAKPWFLCFYLHFQWRLVGADIGGTTLKYKIPLIIGITNCQIKYNKMKHNTHIIILLYYYYYFKA